MIRRPRSWSARRRLRIPAAEVTRRQHRLRADVPEHRLRREPDLREQALRAAPRKVEHRVGILGSRVRRVADDRDDRVVLDVEQRARRALGQSPRHRLVDEMDRPGPQRPARPPSPAGASPVPAVSPRRCAMPWASRCARYAQPTSARLASPDRRRIGRIEEEHRRRGGRPERPLPLLAQQVAHRDRDVAEVDVDRARRERTCGTPCSDRRRRRTRRSGAATRRAASAPRTGRPRSAATRRESCCAANTADSRAARASRRRACTCRSAGSP